MIDEVGELVITAPMPSMPVFFWGDEDGTRLHDSYFADYPGMWRHGDWIRITSRGSCVIEGRSDATLNRGGVRMGTAEFYRVVESVPEVADSLVVDTSSPSGEGDLLLFVVLDPAARTSTAVSAAAPDADPHRAVAAARPGRGGPGARGAADAERQEMRGAGEADPRRRPVEAAVSRDALADPAGFDALLSTSRGPRWPRGAADEAGRRFGPLCMRGRLPRC